MTHPALAHLRTGAAPPIPGVPASVAELLDPLVDRCPDDVAIIDRDRELTFRALDRAG